MNSKRKDNEQETGIKILWVENDPAHIQDYADALRDLGYVVLIAANITDAKKTIQENPDIYIAILDVILPISSQEQDEFELDVCGGSRAGLALGRWIRNNFPEMKLFGFSVKIDKIIVDWFKKFGSGFVSKQSFPDGSEFAQYFRRIVMKERQLNYLKSFIVHGHDEKDKLALKNYLQNTLGLPEPVILHEKPSMGRTIIEKFEQLSDNIDVAFVLLTPDDKALTEKPDDSITLRARQNVIFELGYFIAKMQRKNGRVILLYKGSLELPTDLSGLIYINIDDGIENAGEKIRRELMSI